MNKTSVVRIDAENIRKIFCIYVFSIIMERKTAKIKIGRDTAIIYNGMVLETDYDSAFNI